MCPNFHNYRQPAELQSRNVTISMPVTETVLCIFTERCIIFYCVFKLRSSFSSQSHFSLLWLLNGCVCVYSITKLSAAQVQQLVCEGDCASSVLCAPRLILLPLFQHLPHHHTPLFSTPGPLAIRRISSLLVVNEKWSLSQVNSEKIHTMAL